MTRSTTPEEKELTAFLHKDQDLFSRKTKRTVYLASKKIITGLMLNS